MECKMNFFPGLQIHVYSSPPVPPARSPVLASSNLSDMLQSLIQQINPQSQNRDNTHHQEESAQQREVQIVFGFEAPGGRSDSATATETEQQRAMTLAETNNFTELFVYLDNNNESDVCGICHQAFDDREICRRILRCQHFFHCTCVDSWIARHPTCPICRDEIIT